MVYMGVESSAMKNFLKFVRSCAEIRYDVRMHRIAESGEPCMLSFPLFRPEVMEKDLNHLKNERVNVSYLCLPEGKDCGCTEIGGIEILSLAEIEKAYSNGVRTVYHHPAGTWIPYSDFFAKYGMEMIVYQGVGKDAACISKIDALLSHIDLLGEVYENFSDQRSKEVYLAVLRGLVSQSYLHYCYEDAAQYFMPGYLPEAGDVVIDGGAYDGRTAVDFAQCGCRVYSFELDAVNADKARHVVSGYDVVLENLGLGRAKETLPYVCASMSSRLENGAGDRTAQVIDLDTYVYEQGIQKVDFIKLDIEGAEYHALQGATLTISKWKPKLAICMYHKTEDMWELPRLIRSLRSDYEFAFRHYPVDGRFGYLSPIARRILDGCGLSYFVKSMAETILYCR